jgi:hypothetical protein
MIGRSVQGKRSRIVDERIGEALLATCQQSEHAVSVRLAEMVADRFEQPQGLLEKRAGVVETA